MQLTGQLKAAKSFLLQSYEARRKVLGNQYPDTANGIVNLARLLLQLGKEDEAKGLAKESHSWVHEMQQALASLQ